MSTSAPNSELFVTKGILPENLPPVFTTRNVWAELSIFGSVYTITRTSVGDPAVFNASKRGGQRRMFSIPHPAFIRDQALFFEKHWPDLSSLMQSSDGSASKPVFGIEGPRHVRIMSHSDLPRLRLRKFSRFKFCLITDVSRFFPSIYTHSIPWAINGKAASKIDPNANSATIFGNRLDFILRQSQSKQTIGIAIGPDTSKVVSEIIMASVDQSFVNRSGKIKPIFVRHVDDYWIAGNTHEECEKHLQNLRLALKEFELDINETKTKIVSTKLVFGEDWPFSFDKEIVDSLRGHGSNKNEALAILSNIVDRATVTSDDGIIRHAIRKIDENRLWSSDWEILEHFLAQCAVQFPHSFDYVARVVAWRLRTSKDVDVALWRDVAILTINQNASIGHDSEVIWALWLMKELGAKIPKESTDHILLNSGALTLCFLSHFCAKRLTTDRKLKQKLWACVSGNAFAGSFWPLTLEMIHLGIGNPLWMKEVANPSLRRLHELKASIIDWSARPRVFDEDEPDGGNDGDDEPDFAIEDYGADYGDYDDEDNEEGGKTVADPATDDFLRDLGLLDLPETPEVSPPGTLPSPPSAQPGTELSTTKPGKWKLLRRRNYDPKSF